MRAKVRTDVGLRHLTPNVISRIQVGEKGVAVDRTQRNTEHGVEQIGREDVQLYV